MFKKSFLIAGIVAVAGFSAHSEASCTHNGKSYKVCKGTQHLGNKQTAKILLDHNKVLWRVPKAGPICTMTTKVDEIKMAQHKNDVALVYYRKGSDLYLANDASRCSKSAKSLFRENIKKFNTVSNANSTIVNVTLDTKGEFRAWGVKYSLVTVQNVKDYEMNSKNYAVKGKPFSRFVAFLERGNGQKVVKVQGGRVKESGSVEKVDAIEASETSLAQFLRNSNL